jgi:hypothetical protein
MKYWALLFISSSLLASPMTQMGQRLKVYGEVNAVNCAENSAALDEGIFIDVSCSLKCLGKDSQIERVRSPFIPRQLGMMPGNGSNSDQMILWGGLNVGLKMWSDKICLEKAGLACKDDSAIEHFEVAELKSGGWRVNRMPGCQEKEITLSPFFDEVKPDRVPALANFLDPNPKQIKFEMPLSPSFSPEPIAKSFKLQVNKKLLSLAFAKEMGKNQKCERVISANICFGDCIDLNGKEKDIVETIATPEPLGRETVTICGDSLYEKLITEKLSPAMKKYACESYFWNSLLSEDNLTYKTCAATRGDVDCQSFIAN